MVICAQCCIEARSCGADPVNIDADRERENIHQVSCCAFTSYLPEILTIRAVSAVAPAATESGMVSPSTLQDMNKLGLSTSMSNGPSLYYNRTVTVLMHII